MAVQVRVTGRVTDTDLRFSRTGVPLLILHLEDRPTQQRVVVRIPFTDGSHATQFLAGAQRARYRNQAITLDCINPRFRKARLECEASPVAGVQIVKGSPQ